MDRQQLLTVLDQAAESDEQHAKQHQVHPTPAPAAYASSPSHEFSFTISLHSRAKSSPIYPDLSPADDIFFHGYLLPHGLLPVPACRALPAQEWQQHNSVDRTGLKDDQNPDYPSCCQGTGRSARSGKSKSFSLFGRKGREGKDRESKLKSKFEIVKKCVRLIKLKTGFLSFRMKKGSSDESIQREEYSSYSGNLRVGNKEETQGRRRELSAPVSMRTSPANSGVFVDSGTVTPTTGKSDSTVEELQAAIQAAIAHCKNSIAPPNGNDTRLP